MRRGPGIETARRKYRRHTQYEHGSGGNAAALTRRAQRNSKIRTVESVTAAKQDKSIPRADKCGGSAKSTKRRAVLKPANRRIWNIIGAANRAHQVNTAALHSTFAAARDRYAGMEKNNAPGSLKKSACGNARAAPTWGEERYECTAKRLNSAALRPSGGESMGCCAFTNETQAKICARPF